MTTTVYPKAIWHVYEWPGGQWAICAWTTVPGAPSKHGPVLTGASLEDVRAHLPEGVKRYEPSDADREHRPWIRELWA